ASFVFTSEPLYVAAKDHSTNQRQLPVFVSKHLLFIYKDNSIFFPSFLPSAHSGFLEIES
ncbi:hypothetical protein ACXWP3_09460, partial [Streptococcus pyogenes]